MDKDRDRVIEQIGHLLAVAEGQSTNPNEAATAAAQAQKLMLKYKVTRDDIKQDEENAIRVHDEPILEGKRLNSWELGLANAISQVNACLNILVQGGKTQKIIIVGKEEDVLVVRALYNYLHGEIERLTRRAQNYGTIYGREEANNFRLGALVAIATALKNAQQSVENECGSTAIVKLERSSAETEQWAQDNLPGLNMNKKRKVVEVDANERAFVAGMHAGNRVNVVDPKKTLKNG